MTAFERKLEILVSIVALAWGTSAHAQVFKSVEPPWMLTAAINPIPNWYEVRGGTWRVPPEMVERIASLLKAELSSSMRDRLPSYVIQYQGESPGDVRSVRLMGACATSVKNEREFSARFYIVFDGGKCFFDASYDPEEERITFLRFHGHA